MLKKLLVLFLITAPAFAGTITGNLGGPSGLPVKNGTLTFQLQQAGLINGTGAVANTSAQCYTDTNGAVVGLPNPIAQIASSINYGSGSLPAGIYFVELTFYNGSQETIPSPELRIQLTGAGTLTINPPTTFPAGASGMRVYIGSTSGGEQLQGATTSGTAQYSQSVALASGSAPPSNNTSICSIAFNDTIIPFSGYNVSLISSAGNAYPGWPQAWQLNGGPSGTINVSQGAPLWNGVVIYPSPVLMQPLNHGPQSISGTVNMAGYDLINIGEIGVGTSTPSYPIDVENGQINTNLGFSIGGTAPTGHCLIGNGTVYADSASCAGTGQQYYYIDFSNSIPVPQRGGNNFLPPLVATDNAPGNTTNITLGTSGVTAGTYTNPTVTFDAYGRATSASNGNSIPKTQVLIIANPCTTAATAYAQCSAVQTWPTAFADAGYGITCTAAAPSGSSAALTQVFWTGRTTTGFTLWLQNGDASGAGAVSVAEVDCIGTHP